MERVCNVVIMSVRHVR